MKYLQNLHTHSTYDDGKDSPEEMIKSAISQRMHSVGFSGHSYVPYGRKFCMSKTGTENFKKEISFLKKKYKDDLEIFCGLEFDMYSDTSLSGYDYLIGSMHYLKKGNDFIGFDRSADEVKSVIDNYFGGDGLKFAKEYYETIANLPEYGNFDIVAHFDIITKNIEIAPLIDIENTKYKSYAIQAAEALVGKIPFFEVNTGAISRGYRTMPYPALFILKELNRMGGKVIISSDCHDSRYIMQSFLDAEELLKECGFNETYVLKKSGFEPIGLEK